MLNLIQAYRGFAALLVVLYHAAATTQAFHNVDYPFHFGWSGVQFFFVLSGYIIMRVHRTDTDVGSFALKRIKRIYPLYILVTLALVVVADAYDGSLILSLLLVPQPHPPLLSVGWTLIHEMMFYVAFACFIANRWAGVALFGVWLITIALQPQGFPFNYLASVNNLLFGLGMLAAVTKPSGWPSFIAGHLLFIAVCATGRAGNFELLALGVASFAIITSAESLDRFFRYRALTLLGDASYAIYLTHYPAISLWYKVVDRPSFLPCVVFAVLVGIATHLLVEKPLIRLLPWPASRRSRQPARRYYSQP